MSHPERPREIGERSALGGDYLAGRLRQETLSGEFRPSRREDVEEIAGLSPERRKTVTDLARAVLAKGEVAFGLLAAGASTRMDVASMPPSAKDLLDRSGRPQPVSKAMVPVVLVRGKVYNFLDLFFLNLVRFRKETAAANPALLLLSEANAPEIESYLGEQKWFGLAETDVVRFRQKLDRQIVATEADVEKAKKNFANDKDLARAFELARAFAGHDVNVPKPAGHGEFLHQLVSSGTLSRLAQRGIRYVTIRNIDNTGALLDDDWLAILGIFLEKSWRFVLEVSRRPEGPAGKGGALILRGNGDFQIAEDPSLAGTGVSPRDSYYINDAAAILRVDYLYEIYDTSADELAHASETELDAIADRGRKKFPPLIDVKPVKLPSGGIVGAFVRETNLWESTGLARGLRVGAIGVLSVKDIEDSFDTLSSAEQKSKAVRIRFAATKKWEDYDGINAKLVPHVAEKILDGPLVG